MDLSIEELVRISSRYDYPALLLTGSSSDIRQDTAKIVQEKYIAKSDGDIEFNMMVLAGEEA